MIRDSLALERAAGWQDEVSRLAEVDRASWAIQRQLTARGVATVRMPRGTVVGYDGEPISELAFVGFQGPGTTLAGTSLAAHASSVFQVLAAKYLPVQPGRVCTTKQVQAATSYARSVGFPVVVRPANSDRTRKPRIVVLAAEQIPAALERIQAEASDRTVYRETEVRTAWIQKLPSGTLLRILVVGSEAVAVVVGDPVREGFQETPVSEIHPEIRSTAVAALRAFPGLEHGEIDLVVQNPAAAAQGQDLKIMTINSSPVLNTYQTHGDFGVAVAAAVTDHYLMKAGTAIEETSDQRRVKITYTGVVNPEQFVNLLQSRAEKVTGSIAEVETDIPGEDTVSALHHGDPGTSALLSAMGVRGLVGGQRASTALTEVIE